MSRAFVACAIATSLLTGCATSGPPNLTAEQRKSVDLRMRVMFASMIANHRAVGTNNWLVGKREYENARVSGPGTEDGVLGKVKRICAKVYVKNDVVGGREFDISAEIIEGPKGAMLTMSKNNVDFLGQRCTGPYVPFPELQTLSPKS